MPRTRRYIEAGKTYELILRVKSGLPFRPGPLVNSLIEGVIARAPRDNKVILCHYLWMSNHVHIILVVKNALACVNFYQEIQKKLTDIFKRLLGVRKLNMWEGDPVLAQILDVDKAIDRIAYLYANPARADLCESIEEYPGLNSFNVFLNASKQSKAVPWIRLPWIQKLPSLRLSRQDEQKYLAKILPDEHETFPLEVFPNAWMETFKIDDEKEMKSINKKITFRTREKETDAEERRKSKEKQSVSRKALESQIIFAPHTPSKRERRIFVLSSCKKLRQAFITTLKEFCSRCASCYGRALKGIQPIPWPPQAFIPALPPPSCSAT